MALVGVIFTRNRLIGTAKANQVGGDHAMAFGSENRRHLAVEIAPGRLSVQKQDRIGIRWAFVDIVNAQAINLCILRSEVVARQIGKTIIRSAKKLHGWKFYNQ